MIGGSPIPGPSQIISKTPSGDPVAVWRRRLGANLTPYYSRFADSLRRGDLSICGARYLDHVDEKDRDYFRTTARSASAYARSIRMRTAKQTNRISTKASRRCAMTLKSQPFLAVIGRSMPITPYLAHSNGRGASVRTRCWRGRSVADCGVIACSTSFDGLARAVPAYEY